MTDGIKPDSLERSIFDRLLEEYTDMVHGTQQSEEKKWEQLQKANQMLEAWKQYIPPVSSGSAWAAKNFLAPIQQEYTLLYWYKNLLEVFMNKRHGPQEESRGPIVFSFVEDWRDRIKEIVSTSDGTNSGGADEAVDICWAELFVRLERFMIQSIETRGKYTKAGKVPKGWGSAIESILLQSVNTGGTEDVATTAACQAQLRDNINWGKLQGLFLNAFQAWDLNVEDR